MTTIYNRARRKYGLSTKTMADYMEIPHKVYLKLDSGKDLEGEEKMFEDLVRKIGIKKVEELNDVTAFNLKMRGIENVDEVDELEESDDIVEEYYNSIDKKELFDKFNVRDNEHLATILGKSFNKDTISKYFSQRDKAPRSFKETIYNFFTNEKNIQKNVSDYTDNQKWYAKNLNSAKLERLIADKVNNGQIYGCQRKFANTYGLSNSELSRIIHEDKIPSDKYCKIFRELFDGSNFVETSNENEYIVPNNIDTSKFNVLIEKKLNEVDTSATKELEKVKELKEENSKLKIQISKLITIINNLTKEQLIEIILGE